MSQHSYLLKLFQVARVHTESFTVEAESEAEAKKQAEAIAKDKGLDASIKGAQVGAYEFEIEDLSVAGSAGGVETPSVAKEEDAKTTDTTSNELPDTLEEMQKPVASKDLPNDIEDDLAEKAEIVEGAKADSSADEKPTEKPQTEKPKITDPAPR